MLNIEFQLDEIHKQFTYLRHNPNTYLIECIPLCKWDDNSYEVTYFLMLLLQWTQLIIIYSTIACMKITLNYLSLLFKTNSMEVSYLGQSFDIAWQLPPVVGTGFPSTVPSKSVAVIWLLIIYSYLLFHNFLMHGNFFFV